MKNLYKRYLPFLLRQKIELAFNKSDYFLSNYDELGCLFIHIPKGAGTSIAHALYGEQVANHYPASLYCDISEKKFKQYFTFTVVRNPWDRAVSAYNFIKQGGTKYVRPKGNELYKGKEFETFETFVKNVLNNSDLGTHDLVFQPQHKFVCDNSGKILVEHVGHLEKLDETLKILSDRIGKKVELPVINHVKKSQPYEAYYTDETYHIVKKIYQKDIVLFGYD